jgi:hypothetical protein
MQARNLHDPEEIENVAWLAASITRAVKLADGHTRPLGQLAECGFELFAVQRAKCCPYGFDGYRVDVAADRREAELVCLANRRARSHKRIEYREVRSFMRLIKRLGKLAIRGQCRTKQDAPKDRA